MKIIREATKEEVAEIWQRLTSPPEPGEHKDICTQALCYCKTGLEDGTPKPPDYEAAGQPLPGFGQSIDFVSVFEVVKQRMPKEFSDNFVLPKWAQNAEK